MLEKEASYCEMCLRLGGQAVKMDEMCPECGQTYKLDIEQIHSLIRKKLAQYKKLAEYFQTDLR